MVFSALKNACRKSLGFYDKRWFDFAKNSPKYDVKSPWDRRPQTVAAY